MSKVIVEDEKGRRLRLATNRMYLTIGGARGPAGIDIVGDVATRAGKLLQFAGGGRGRTVVPVSGGGADNTLRADLSSAVGDYLVSTKLLATAAVDINQGEINRALISSVWFGTVGDGSADDTAALQAYANYADGFSRALIMHIVGRCRITQSIMLDRLSDTKNSYLRILGVGVGAGILRDGDFPIFDSNLTSADIDTGVGNPPAPTGTPCSEKVSLEGLVLEGVDPADLAGVFSKKFLRSRCIDCNFYRIGLGDWSKGSEATGYAQQISIVGGHATDWQGYFLDAFQWYHLTVANLDMEFGQSGFRARGGIFQAGFTHFAFEGCSGGAVWIAGGFNMGMSDCYLEGNGAYCTFTDADNGGRIEGLTLRNIHITLTAGQSADTAFYPIALGDARGTGNVVRCLNGNLYDDTHTTHGNFVSIEDRAIQVGAKLNKTGLPITAAGLYRLKRPNVDVTAIGTDADSAFAITGDLVRVISGTGGVRLPPIALTLFGDSVTVINFSPNSITIYPPAGATINVASTFVMPPSCIRTFYYTPDAVWSARPVMPFQGDLSTGATLAEAIADINTIKQHLRDIGEQQQAA